MTDSIKNRISYIMAHPERSPEGVPVIASGLVLPALESAIKHMEAGLKNAKESEGVDAHRLLETMRSIYKSCLVGRNLSLVFHRSSSADQLIADIEELPELFRYLDKEGLVDV